LSRSIAIMPAAPPEPNPTLTPVPGPRDPGAPRVETGTSRTKVFYGARRAVTFSYRIQYSAPVSVRIDLVRGSDGAVAKTWNPPAAQPGQVNSLVWSGRAASGRYSFRLTAQAASGAVARSASPEDASRDAFDLYSHIFPVRGRHDYGGAGARFGAGRAGHRHQGQDVMARCGTKLVAARGGRVQYSGYHRAAGYYLVVDGTGSDIDYVYMHLAEPSPWRKGDRVYTGTRIGSVGQTGNARGCHLHFELWQGDWYRGGHPFDPLPSLRTWDSWS
jgi:murein DD-endopeptidase MepM/ murein hydrolase activator NlpD